MSKLLTSFFLLALVFGVLPARMVRAAELTALADVQPGDLIRGQAFSAVYYYGNDGFRYVFPNDKTYFTWYSNFDTVKWVSDADLGKVQIGGNVTYKPLSRMIKINTDPKVYIVGPGGTLLWVSSEASAVSYAGSDWNTKIDDVADGFFSNYTQNNDVYDPTSSMMIASATINDDKDLNAFTTITVSDNAYSDTEVNIQAGDVVRFVNNGANKHTATADDLSWGSGTISPNGGFWQHRFAEAGTYTFFCSYHPSMTGAIVVE